MLNNFKQKLTRFTSCSNGNLSIVFAFSAIPMLIAGGSAMDYARLAKAKEQTTLALDSAVLAAVSVIQNDTDITAVDIQHAKDVANKQFDSVVGPVLNVEVDAPVFVFNSTGDGFNGTVHGHIKNSVMKLVGLDYSDFNVQADAVAGFDEVIGSDLEVAMMLDVTGSMCNVVNGNFAQPCPSSINLDALKSAAKDLVDRVVWTDQSEYKSKLSIVPFAPNVRLAPDGQANALYTAVTGMPTTWTGKIRTYGETQNKTANTQAKCKLVPNYIWKNSKCYQWSYTYTTQTNLRAKPCITERFVLNADGVTGTYGLSDAAPAAGTFSNASDGTRRPFAADSSGTALAQNGSSDATALDAIPDNYSATGVCDGAAHYDASAGAGTAIHNANVMVPLTNNKTVLKERIDSLVAQGSTAGLLGTAVTWYTLSPNWANVWGTESAPQSYSKLTQLNLQNKPKLYKIAVLMTDGEYNASLGSGSFNGNNINVTDIETRVKSMCSSMKALGIEIYTVGFRLTDNSSSKSMLQACANDAEHFKDAASTTALKAAFKTIGDRIKSTALKDVRLAR